MTVSVQVSVYALRQPRLGPAIEVVRGALDEWGLNPEVGPMSSVATGEIEVVFAALKEGFIRAAETGHVVMTVVLSNVCPG